MYEKYVLVYGLSANPIHQVHVDLLSDAAKALVRRGYKIEKAMLIPVYRRNLADEKKDDLPQTFELRFAMCELAAEEIARRLEAVAIPVEVSRIEEKLGKAKKEPNYTLETLLHLQAEFPDVGWIFLLSSDLVSGDSPEFGRWHQPETLVQLATLAICPRPGYQRNEAILKGFEQSGAHFVYLDELVPRDVAASTIKRRLEAGEDPLALSEEGLLPRSVALYIKQYDVYQLKP
jgi:nicotinate-nucleotide adenylyltransferase